MMITRTLLLSALIATFAGAAAGPAMAQACTKQGVDVSCDDGRRGMAVDSLVSGGDIISGASVRRSLLFSNVRVDNGTTIEDSVVLPGVQVGRNVVLKNTVIDKRCVIDDGMRIGVDPTIDRARFYVSPGGVTLVTPEQLGQNIHATR